MQLWFFSQDAKVRYFFGMTKKTPYFLRVNPLFLKSFYLFVVLSCSFFVFWKSD